MRRAAAFFAAALAALAFAVPARAGEAARATAGARWLAQQQRGNGAFFIDGQSADATAEVLEALAAGGVAGETRARALGYIAAHGPKRAREQPAYAGRIVLGLLASDQDPRAFHKIDYVAIVESSKQTTGAYDSRVYADAIAVLALAAAGAPIEPQSVAYLQAQQCASGGYGHDAGCVGDADVDTTAVVVMALARAGVAKSDASRQRARDWLANSARNASGGFGATAGAKTNANSTGLLLSALATTGERADRSPWTSRGAGPARALAALQLGSGAFRYLASEPSANAYATVQAVPGIAGSAYPVAPVRGAGVSVGGGTATPRASDGAAPQTSLPPLIALPSPVPSAYAQPGALPYTAPYAAPSAFAPGTDAAGARSNAPPPRTLPVTAASAALAAAASALAWRARKRRRPARPGDAADESRAA
jgi:hypothetical protein